MKQTENYNLPLYEPNDLADLTDGYNNAMELIDTDLKAVTGGVEAYDARITANATAIDTETNRATEAENANTSSINAEVERAKAAEQTNADAITSLEASVNAKFPVSTDDLAANAVSYGKLSKDVQAMIGGSGSVGSDLVVIGDSVSYGTGATTPSTDGWAYKFAESFGYTLHNYAENNAGFRAAGTGDNKANFVKQAQVAVADSSFENTQVSIVIIMGGCNDSVQNPDIATYVTNALNTCINGFTNAKIYVIPYFWGAAPVYRQSGYQFHVTMNNFDSGIEAATKSKNVRVIKHAWEWMAGKSDLMSDFIHPNTSGHAYLAKVIAGAIESGTDMRPNYHYTNGNFSVDCTEGIVTVSGNFKLSSATTAYGKVIGLPEWAKNSYQNYGVLSYNGSWQTVPLYYACANNELQCPNVLSSGTQIYLNKITFPINI